MKKLFILTVFVVQIFSQNTAWSQSDNPSPCSCTPQFIASRPNPENFSELEAYRVCNGAKSASAEFTSVRTEYKGYNYFWFKNYINKYHYKPDTEHVWWYTNTIDYEETDWVFNYGLTLFTFSFVLFIISLIVRKRYRLSIVQLNGWGQILLFVIIIISVIMYTIFFRSIVSHPFDMIYPILFLCSAILYVIGSGIVALFALSKIQALTVNP